MTVRTVEIDGQLWFSLMDLCNVFKKPDASVPLNRVEPEHARKIRVRDEYGSQLAWFLSPEGAHQARMATRASREALRVMQENKPRRVPVSYPSNSQSSKVSREVDRITTRIEWLISNGELEPGEILPSTKDFVERFRCTEFIAKRARRTLARRGCIVMAYVEGAVGRRYVVVGSPEAVEAPQG